MARSEQQPAKMVTNMGSRRVIVGPPPKSERAPRKLHSGTMLATPADQSEVIPDGKRLPSMAGLPVSVIESPAFKAVAERCSLRVA